MTLRSARTEFLLELTQKLDDLAQRAQSLREEVGRSSATDGSRSKEDHTPDVAEDEQRALEALRASASRLVSEVQEAVGDINTLLDRG